MLFASLQALFSHWARHPVQLITLIVGLSLATGLWTGVQAINSEARSSYHTARSTLASADYASLNARDGGDIKLTTYVRLQQAGWRTSPVLDGQIELNGQKIRILGIDPLSFPMGAVAAAGQDADFNLADFLSAKGQVLAHPSTLPAFAGLENAPHISPIETLAEGTAMVDVSLAEKLLQKKGRVSRLLVLPEQTVNKKPISEIAPHLKLSKPANARDIEGLTDSFHLNLTAFGLLSFAVGLFIVHGTIGLAFEQRRGVFRSLRVLGVPLSSLIKALIVELSILAGVAGVLGVGLGYLIAGALLPDVSATLRGLYGAEVSGTLSFRPSWWLSGLAIACFGTFFAAASSLWKLAKLPVLASAQPRAWALMSKSSRLVQLMAAGVLTIAAGLMLSFGSGLVVSFAMVGAILAAASLSLPHIFSLFLTTAQKLTRGPLVEWFWADTRQQLPGLSLALMALLLALATNVGVSTMVGSFRATFTDWLDQRLFAEVYIEAKNKNQVEEVLEWAKPRTVGILPVWNVEATLGKRSGRIFGFKDDPAYQQNWPLLQKTEGVWEDVSAGKAVLINEQLANRQSFGLGDPIEIAPGKTLPVAAIYSDYGNPNPQLMMNVELLVTLYPDVEQLRYALRVPPQEVKQFVTDIRSKFEFGSGQLINQKDLKQSSHAIFERTFAVTSALNILTLAVAGFAIFTSLLTLSAMRLPQLAPVWALGLTRTQLSWIELARALLLAVMTIVCAVPLGLVLAWLLLAVVNLEAFGWQLPLRVFVGDWVRLFIFGLIATGIAAFVPSRRIGKTAPAELVKVFAHER